MRRSLFLAALLFPATALAQQPPAPDMAAQGLDLAMAQLNNSYAQFGQHYRDVLKELADSKKRVAELEAELKAAGKSGATTPPADGHQ